VGWAAAVVGTVALSAAGGYLVWRNQIGAAPTAASTAMPHIESLAVLPLANLSADSSQDYFADAMTEELTRELSGIKSLRVISRTSTEQYKGVKRNLPDIAKELHVDGIIEGSVVRAGDQVRITAQLIHGSTDRHLWANAYDGDLRDMLALQRRVAEAIAREVRVTVTPEEQETLRASRSIDPRSMDLYLKGRQLLYQGTSTSSGFSRPSLEQALTSFTDALKIQQWAEPYAGLAAVRHWMATAGINPTVLFPASREAAQEAIRLDDRLADGHGSLAYVSFAYDWDLVTAERAFRRAIDLKPIGNYFQAYALLLEALGHFDEAKVMLRKAEERDPLSLIPKLEATRRSLLARDYEDTIQRARQLPAGLGKDPPHSFVGLALVGQGRPDAAIAEFEQMRPAFGARAAIASAMARAGRTVEARQRLHDLERSTTTADDAYDLAGVYVSLGDHARAFDALERAYAGKRTWLPQINVDQAFDDLRGDARFQDLLRRVGFPPKR
jgi:TolB-like protein